MLDKIYIRDLHTHCIVGIDEEEQRKRQVIIINIVLLADLSTACKSDRLKDTIDYSKLKKKIRHTVEESCFFLIEALAQRVAGICLESQRVQKVQVRVDKPGHSDSPRNVAVEIERP